LGQVRKLIMIEMIAGIRRRMNSAEPTRIRGTAALFMAGKYPKW